jgi:hypothetical protein
MSQDTVKELNKGEYTLCSFLACQSPNASLGYPLCWGVTKMFLNSVLISWQNSLCAYVSTSEIQENAKMYIPQPSSVFQSQIRTSKSSLGSVTASSYGIKLGQQMLIEDYGSVSIIKSDVVDTVLIKNDSSNLYSSGIGILDNYDNLYYGICSFNLSGHGNIQIVPVNKVFLMFSSKDVEHNTVISVSENDGILVDFDGSIDNIRTVTYDINTGWTSGQEIWGEVYPSGTNLKKLLISS